MSSSRICAAANPRAGLFIPGVAEERDERVLVLVALALTRNQFRQWWHGGSPGPHGNDACSVAASDSASHPAPFHAGDDATYCG